MHTLTDDQENRASGVERGAAGLTVWLTGLPCAGKTTLARLLGSMLQARDIPVTVLDGDEVRKSLSQGLGFSRADRDENVRRIAQAAKMITEAGAVAVVAAVSPYRESRARARASIGKFMEVHVDCSIEQCIARDTKGMYQEALAGRRPGFTGVSDPYERPERADIIVHTDRQSVEECLACILDAVMAHAMRCEAGPEPK